MAVHTTVVFTDLAGSTGLFESLGNEKATEAVTRALDRVAPQVDSRPDPLVAAASRRVLGANMPGCRVVGFAPTPRSSGGRSAVSSSSGTPA